MVTKASGAPFQVMTVCTGNRARSPLSEVLLRKLLTERGQADAVNIISTGLCAHELGRVGMPANDKCIDVVREFYDIDLTGHRSKALSPEGVLASDVVIVMEAWQQEVVRSAFPKWDGVVLRLGDMAPTDDDGSPVDVSKDVQDIPQATRDEVEKFCADALVFLAAGLESGPLADRLAASLAGSAR